MRTDLAPTDPRSGPLVQRPLCLDLDGGLPAHPYDLFTLQAGELCEGLLPHRVCSLIWACSRASDLLAMRATTRRQCLLSSALYGLPQFRSRFERAPHRFALPPSPLVRASSSRTTGVRRGVKAGAEWRKLCLSVKTPGMSTADISRHLQSIIGVLPCGFGKMVRYMCQQKPAVVQGYNYSCCVAFPWSSRIVFVQKNLKNLNSDL